MLRRRHSSYLRFFFRCCEQSSCRAASTSPSYHQKGQHPLSWGQCLAFGEIVFDVFHHQGATQSVKIGGAPLNFACGLRQLGHPVGLVSAVGDDDHGRQAIEILQSRMVDPTFVAISGRPTGIVPVCFDAATGCAEFDVSQLQHSAIHEIPAPQSTLDMKIQRPALLYIGSLARVSEYNVTSLAELREQLRPVHVFYDANFRTGMWTPEVALAGLTMATTVKVSREELEILLPLAGVGDAAALLERFNLDVLAVTDAGEGPAKLWARGGQYHEVLPLKIDDFVDPVGAGDAFAAALAAGIMRHGLSALQQTLGAATRAGALAVQQSGAAVDLSKDPDIASAVGRLTVAHNKACTLSRQEPCIQLALDTCDLQSAIKIVEETVAGNSNSLDVIEIGTPFIMKAGLGVVSEFKRRFPGQILLADLKIMDAGYYEAQLGFEAGADIVTVLGLAHDSTIKGVVSAARTAGQCRLVMADMVGIRKQDALHRVKELLELGVDIICVHTASDRQAHDDPLQLLKFLSWALYHGRSNGILAVAGGVKPSMCAEIMKANPRLVIVGSFITSSINPAIALSEIRCALKASCNDEKACFAGAGKQLSEHLRSIPIELTHAMELVAEHLVVQDEKVLIEIASARRIFVAGAGRSGYAMQSFGMRLMHLGFSAHVIGQTATPSCSSADLVIIGSASGSTSSMISIARKAKDEKARLLVLSARPASPIACLADVLIRIQAPTPKGIQLDSKELTSNQPMGALFEQTLLLTLDGVVLALMERLGQTADEMFSRHASLE